MMSSLFREQIRRVLNRTVFHRMGLDLRKKRDELEFASRNISEREKETLADAISEAAVAFLSGSGSFLGSVNSHDIKSATHEFMTLYGDRPVQDNAGGSQFNDSYWIYLMARVMNPSYIIESGVHKGHSTWLFRMACPDAHIRCFDILLANRIYHDDKADYHECDWMSEPVSIDNPDQTLCFFDDHINHAKRISEAHDRGLRWLLIDDDFTAETLYATGGPPIPSVHMLFDDGLKNGDKLQWQRHGKAFSYEIDRAEMQAVRNRVANHAWTPELAPITRYRPQSGLTVLQLKD